MDPHTSDRNAHRAATALAMMLDLREENDQLKHDLDAVHSGYIFFEQFLEGLGWRLATPEESPIMTMVPIIEEEEEADQETRN